MCKLCDESEMGYVCCSDCGRMVCFDVQSGDDIIRPAYVTTGGDLKCDLCGPDYDREDEDDIFDPSYHPGDEFS